MTNKTHNLYYLRTVDQNGATLYWNTIMRDWFKELSNGCLYQSRADADEDATQARDSLNPYDVIRLERML